MRQSFVVDYGYPCQLQSFLDSEASLSKAHRNKHELSEARESVLSGVLVLARGG